MLQVLLPAEFGPEHRRIVLSFVQRGHEFGRVEWGQAIAAFDMLKNAAVLTEHGLSPFPVIYRQQVEEPYAGRFIEALYQAEDVAAESAKRWATIARAIEPHLSQAGWSRLDIPATRLIVAYCLYWWRAFTVGYALEIEIQRDLKASGIRFQAHGLRQPEERLSPFDLEVLGFKGDIKTSVYFLQAARSQTLLHDFYITRIQGQRRTRTLVVFVQADMWEAIDGETVLVLLEEVADTLPQAARIVHQGIELTVIHYETWKARVKHRQEQDPGNKREELDGSADH
jgi:hypothetical protein